MNELIIQLLSYRACEDKNSRESSTHSGNLFKTEYFTHYFLQGTRPNEWIDITQDKQLDAFEIKNAMMEKKYKPKVRYRGFDFEFKPSSANSFQLTNEEVGVIKCVIIEMPFHAGITTL